MTDKFNIAHMRAAFIYADLSYCVRKKVGCVIVKNGSIIAIGYNGTPAGEDNCCETEDGDTKDTVIHAEDNALRKLTSSSAMAEGAEIYITCAPCKYCAPRIIDAGIKKVFFVDSYRCQKGIQYLAHRGVDVTQLPTHHFNQ